MIKGLYGVVAFDGSNSSWRELRGWVFGVGAIYLTAIDELIPYNYYFRHFKMIDFRSLRLVALLYEGGKGPHADLARPKAPLNKALFV